MPAKKKVGSKHRAKNGSVYVITKRGARFISGPTKGRGSKKGGSAATGGSARTGGAARVGGAARGRKRRPKKRGGSVFDDISTGVKRRVNATAAGIRRRVRGNSRSVL